MGTFDIGSMCRFGGCRGAAVLQARACVRIGVAVRCVPLVTDSYGLHEVSMFDEAPHESAVALV